MADPAAATPPAAQVAETPSTGLTSVAFGVAAVTLARRRVLVQQLPAVEGLARVDMVCLDKTGTLTDGTIGFDSLIRLDKQAPAEAALGALADDENRNTTLAAIGQAFPQPWPGFGVFCLYAAAALTAGIVLIGRRDA